MAVDCRDDCFPRAVGRVGRQGTLRSPVCQFRVQGIDVANGEIAKPLTLPTLNGAFHPGKQTTNDEPNTKGELFRRKLPVDEPQPFLSSVGQEICARMQEIPFLPGAVHAGESALFSASPGEVLGQACR